MTRFTATIPVLAVLALTGCATYDSNPPQPVASVPARGAIVTAPAATVTAPAGATVVVPQIAAVAFKTGSGQIESISMLRVAQPASASAGSSSSNLMAYRLMVRMDDGSVQTIDQDNRTFLVGDRIRITSDGHVVR